MRFLPNITKYGQYKLFEYVTKHFFPFFITSSANIFKLFDDMFKIEKQTDLHYEVVAFIRKRYLDTNIIAQCGENKDTTYKRRSY